MIGINNKTVQSFFANGKPVKMLFTSTKLIWEAISNCLAGGWWQHGHGWQHGIGWKQNHK